MSNLSQRIQRLAESETIAMSQRSRDLQSQGVDVINLSLGEPDFNTPEFIKEAAIQAVRDNYSHYPPVPGYLEVREAISAKLKRDNGAEYAPNQIVISTGAKQSLMNAVLCLVDPGDKVVVAAPYWVSYQAMIEFAEGELVPISTGVEQNFKITPEQLDEALDYDVKAFMFSSPSNPTGGAYTADELKALGEVFKKYPNVFILSDEIYEHIRFVGSHFSLASIPELYDRVITINGVSKSFAMTGWRIGYIAAPIQVAKACTKMQGQFTSAPSGISQMAAKAAMEADPADVQFMVEAFSKRRSIMIKGLNNIPGFICNEPEGAFYLFPKISDHLGKSFEGQPIDSAKDFCMYLMNEAHVATVPGSAFGADEYIRLSYAASEEQLLEALSRIETAVMKLD
ncbi:MAG: pyridoxal phosphate-dependent aminotransferase [Flavobacteriales bacterium]|jgi:aspartate aminotransferase|nr:pyridoxal phosphate-dependent aminotransferase [Flavobacteriales bacterium]MBT3962596.1 pyridoxal phosphate-dependent aminotransferase [Flavobacteriales bacterium]MBT4705183.1 pyridoxal phosphate-dependent aminotransferase [Flavobacteriales bacterium]MBT4930401.1 pyridoxal phosphate-dependent aminotransferase [Flavobacteriales bacterium]MBT5132624.1 pyridoxal phosphate-dependent aminotransferase [Flavobacteriales bacterium]